MVSPMDGATIILITGTLLSVAIYAGAFTMSAATDRLTASMTALASSVSSATAALKVDPTGDASAINAVSDQLDAMKSSLDAAVAAQTSTAPQGA